MINIKYLDPNKIKIEHNSYKGIFIYYTGHVLVKDLSYATSTSVRLCIFFINEINEYIEESNENRYLTLVPTILSQFVINVTFCNNRRIL